MTADVSGTAVATVVVEVTASDIPTTLVFNIPLSNGVASGMIKVTAGSNRTVTVRAFDAGGIQTHTGSVTLNVQTGLNPTITMVLAPLSGDVPINATLGSITVTVTPTPDTLSLGSAAHTVQLLATIVDAEGNHTAETPRWATLDPGVASVSETGLVTALGFGRTNVFATFQGAVGWATITVTP